MSWRKRRVRAPSQEQRQYASRAMGGPWLSRIILHCLQCGMRRTARREALAPKIAQFMDEVPLRCGKKQEQRARAIHSEGNACDIQRGMASGARSEESAQAEPREALEARRAQRGQRGAELGEARRSEARRAQGAKQSEERARAKQRTEGPGRSKPRRERAANVNLSQPQGSKLCDFDILWVCSCHAYKDLHNAPRR